MHEHYQSGYDHSVVVFIFFRFFKIDNKYSENLSSEIKKKSELLFEKSIDSKLRIKKNSKNQENIYNESGRKNIENIIENNLE